jgi:hypothetical protein
MIDARGAIPESRNCIDCGVNTAPGFANREEIERALAIGDSVEQYYDEHSEIYMVKPKIWKAAGMDDMGGCLCIGCLEKRLGRTLKPKDFLRNHPFNNDEMPGTERLLTRRGG